MDLLIYSLEKLYEMTVEVIAIVFSVVAVVHLYLQFPRGYYFFTIVKRLYQFCSITGSLLSVMILNYLAVSYLLQLPTSL